MSRIGRAPVTVPDSVEVSISNHNTVSVKGPLGALSRRISPLIKAEFNEGTITLTKVKDIKEAREQYGLSRTLVNNMVEGVTKGFSKSLTIFGVGYKAAYSNGKVTLQIGFSHPVEVKEIAGITLSCPTQTEVKVTGPDKEAVGQFAAKIRAIKPVEPYHSYGIRYSDEVVIKKEGKKAGKK